MQDHDHPQVTRRSHYRYLFTAKHHGGGSADDARWSAAISEDEEFSVFDEADDREISDENGRVYGVLVDAEGALRALGNLQQQVAEFPRANEGMPWHGYPIWAVNQDAPASLSGQKMRPAKLVFQKMERAGLITKRQRKRLYKGDHA